MKRKECPRLSIYISIYLTSQVFHLLFDFEHDNVGRQYGKTKPGPLAVILQPWGNKPEDKKPTGCGWQRGKKERSWVLEDNGDPPPNQPWKHLLPYSFFFFSLFLLMWNNYCHIIKPLLSWWSVPCSWKHNWYIGVATCLWSYQAEHWASQTWKGHFENGIRA